MKPSIHRKMNRLMIPVTAFLVIIALQSFALQEAVRFKVTQGSYSDETVVRFLPDATAEFDASYDAWKRFSGSTVVPFIYSYTSDSLPLSINSLPAYGESVEVAIYLDVQSEGTPDISWEFPGAFPPEVSLSLSDAEAGVEMDLYNIDHYSFSSTQGQRLFILKVTREQKTANITVVSTEAGCDLEGSLEITTDMAPVNAQVLQNGQTVREIELTSTGTVVLDALAAGTYQVHISQNSQEIYTASHTITAPVLPEARFEITNTHGTTFVAGDELNFENTSVNATSYVWTFSDGFSTQEISPVHAFSQSGSYVVTLMANNEKCNTEASQTIIIEPGITGLDQTNGKETIDFYYDRSNRRIHIRDMQAGAVIPYILVDSQGRLLKKGHMNSGNKTIETGLLPAGIYFLQAEISGTITTFKFHQ